MDIFSFITLFGGLAFFLFGMNVMSSGLEKMAGGKLESSLKKMTSNPFKSLLLGAGITIAIQSSSAVTVMLVGLVNSGIMQLGQTIGVIMGSNIGTTLTAWILSLSGVEGNGLIQLLKPENFSPIFALIGIILMMMSKSDKKKSIGSILVGFSVLMTGMTLMSDSMSPLADSEAFQNIMVMFNNPLFGVVVGAVITGIIQSSEASVGILQALAIKTGSISYGMAIPIIMGQNIGTCVTALISSIGVNKNARRVAVVHISFNLIGTAICLSLFYGVNAFCQFDFVKNNIDGFGISLVHTIFNVVTTAMLLPFTRQLEKIANFVIRDKGEDEKEKFSFIDFRLLSTPSVATVEARNKTVEMCKVAFDSICESIDLIFKYEDKKAKNILDYEDKLDYYEDKIGTYLVKLSQGELSKNDSNTVSMELRAIGDFERIGDHAVNLLKVSQEIKDKKLKFSKQAVSELKVLTSALYEIFSITKLAYDDNDVDLAKRVEPLEQVIDSLTKTIRMNHVNRLSGGECTLEMGFVLSDLLNNFERVSDHCSNIAVAIIELENDELKSHKYLNAIKYSNDKEFNDSFEEYKERYSI